jgi:hypothetical protein
MTRVFIAAAIMLASAVLPTPDAGESKAVASQSGAHDFDWEIGSWDTKVRVRRNPLSGQPAQWVNFTGTSVVKPLLDGRANFVELSVTGPASKIEGASLRLYSPQSRQWSLNFANLNDGLLTAPVYGGFHKDGRGLFYGHDMLNGRAILVRFIVMRPSANEAQFEQAYSVDGGMTWEDNWIATDRRR